MHYSMNHYFLSVFFTTLCLLACHSVALESFVPCRSDSNVLCEKTTHNSVKNVIMKGLTFSDSSQGSTESDTDGSKAVTAAEGKIKEAKTETQKILNSANEAKQKAEEFETKEVVEVRNAKNEAERIGKDVNEATLHVNEVIAAFNKITAKTAEAKKNTSDAVTLAETEVQNVAKANTLLSSAKSITDNSKVQDKKTNAAKAGSDAENAKTAAKKISTDITTYTTEIQKEIQNLKVALEKVRTIVFADTVTKACVKANEHHDEAVKKKKNMDAFLKEMEKLNEKCPEDVKSQIAEKIKEAKSEQTVAEEEIKKANNAKQQAEEEKPKVTTAVIEVKKQTEITGAAAQTRNTNGYVTVANEAVSKAAESLKKVQIASEKVEKIRHAFVVILSASKAESTAKKVKTHVDTITEQKKKVSAIVLSIKNLKKKVSSEIKELLEPRLQDAQENLQIVTDSLSIANASLKETVKQQIETQNTLRAMKTITDLNEIRNKSQTAENSAEKAEQELRKTEEALKKSTVETEKAKKTEEELTSMVRNVAQRLHQSKGVFNSKEDKASIHNFFISVISVLLFVGIGNIII